MPPISAVAASVSESCVWNVIARGDADLRREQAAGDAGDERREGERPELVERDVHAGGERGRLALADRRPGAAGLARDVQQREQEHDRGDDDGVAVVRGVALARSPACAPGGVVREVGVADRPVKPPPPFGKSVADSTIVRRAGEHQRDQREVEAREPERRQPDEHADHAR